MASPGGRSSKKVMKSPSPSKPTLSKANLGAPPTYLPSKHRMPNQDLATHFDSHTIFRQQINAPTDSTTTFMLAQPGQKRAEPRQFSIPSEKTLKPQHRQPIQGSPKPRSNLHSYSQRPSDHITSLTAASKIYLNADPSTTPRSHLKQKGLQIHIASKSSFPDYSGKQLEAAPSSNRDDQSRNHFMDSREVPKTSEPLETGF